MKPFAFCFINIILLSGCQDTIGEDYSDNDRLVIEGWIDSGGHPSVILTRSFSPMNPEATSLSDLVVRWAEVTVSDGFRTETLAGHIDRSISPPFIYSSPQLTGIPGQTYTVTASIGDKRVTASCTMPNPTLIDSLTMRPIAGSDSLREILVGFTPAADACYQLCVYSPEISGRSLPCFMGTYRAPADETGPVTLSVCRPKTDTDSADFVPYFSVGDRLIVTLTTITPEVWEFWRCFDDITAFGGNIFLAGNITPGSNVAGGYGIWNARAVDSRIITVE